MADDASVTISATILPDEISKTISGSMTVTPDDANDKWYYKLTACTTTSTDLIAGSFLDYTAVDDDTAPTAITSWYALTGERRLIIWRTVYSSDQNNRGLEDCQIQPLQIYTPYHRTLATQEMQRQT